MDDRRADVLAGQGKRLVGLGLDLGVAGAESRVQRADRLAAVLLPSRRRDPQQPQARGVLGGHSGGKCVSWSTCALISRRELNRQSIV
ncbi:hypothetical protein GCM10027258_38980 [Amycolatopsis stemonae]